MTKKNFQKMYEKDKLYTFTVNPADKYQEWGTNARLYQFMDKMRSYFRRHLRQYAHFILLPEISNKGRIHFHGYIQIKDVAGFYLYALRRLENMSMYEIDTIKDLGTWTSYVYKNKDIMEPACSNFWFGYALTHETGTEAEYHRNTLRKKKPQCHEVVLDGMEEIKGDGILLNWDECF